MKSIFVSSTFRDMQAERDALALHVLPELNEFASVYAQNLQLIDLRWGVDTDGIKETEANKKVLTVCLDEIDHARPYMIVLIGERYGWVPPSSLLSETATEKRYDLYDYSISVTELEIEYGALSNQEQFERCLFYFRSPLSPATDDSIDLSDYLETKPENIDKLERLKQKIISRGGNVKEYSCEVTAQGLVVSPAFTKMVIADVKQLFTKEFNVAKNLSWQEKEENSAIAFSEQKAIQFSARYDTLTACKALLQHDNRQLFILQGDSGTGKSTLLAKLYLEYKETANTLMLCSGNTSTQTSLDLVKQVVYKLERILCMHEHFGQGTGGTLKEYVEKFQTYAALYQESNLPPFYIFVDALDQLFQDETVEGFLWLPSQLPACIKIITCATNAFNLSTFYHLKDTSYIQPLFNLTPEERPAVIQAILDNQKKTLSPPLVQAILATDYSCSPLYLSMMLQRLIMLNSDDFKKVAAYGNDMNAIKRHLADTITKTSGPLDALCAHVLEEAAQRINPALCTEAAKLLAVSRRGLRGKDLQALLKEKNIQWNALDFALFVKYLKVFFIHREDGRIDFAHKSIRDGFAKLVDAKEYHQRIFNHLKTLEDGDAIKTDEVLWHAYHSDDSRFVCSYIAHICEHYAQHIPATRNELYKIALHNAAWVKSTILASVANDKLYSFTNFSVHDFPKPFSPSTKEQQLLLPLMEAAKTIADYLEATYPHQETASFVSDCEIVLGEICERLNKPKESLLHYQLSLKKNEEIIASLEEKEEESAVDKKLEASLSNEAVRKRMQQRGINPEDMLELMGVRKSALSTLLKVHYAKLYRKLMLSYSKLSNAYLQHGDAENAAFCRKKSLQLNTSLHSLLGDGASERDLAISLLQTGAQLYHQKKFNEALKHFLKAQELFETLETDEDLNSKQQLVVVYNNIGDTCEQLDSIEQSVNIFYTKAYKKALEIIETSNREEFYIDFAHCLQRMAIIYSETEPKKALAYLTKAIKYTEISYHNMQTAALFHMLLSYYRQSASLRIPDEDDSRIISDYMHIVELCTSFNTQNLAFMKKFNMPHLIGAYSHLCALYMENDCRAEIEKTASKFLDLTIALDYDSLFYHYLSFTQEFCDSHLKDNLYQKLLNLYDILYANACSLFESMHDATSLGFTAAAATYKGELYYHFKKYDDAFICFEDAAKRYSKLKDATKDSQYFFNHGLQCSRLGDTCKRKGLDKDALAYYVESVGSFYDAHLLAEDDSTLEILSKQYHTIALLQESLGYPEKAKLFYYLEQHPETKIK